MTRKVQDEEWMRTLLRECEVGHLGLSDGSQPYVVPINYAYLDDKIVFHCAIRGRKLDLIRDNSACCFSVDRHPDRIAYYAEKRCHYRYHSVLVFGRARFLDEAGERLNWITRFRDHFSQRLGWTIPPELDLDAVKKVGIVVIDIDQMTCRKEEGQDNKAVLSQPLEESA